MSTLTFIWRNLDQFRRRFALVFFSGTINGAITFLIPVSLAEFTKSEFNQERFGLLVGIIISLYGVGLGFQWIIRKYGESLAAQFGNYIRLKYFRRLEHLPVRDLSRHHSGYVLSLINRVADGLPNVIFDLFWTLSHSIANITLFFYFSARESIPIAVFNVVVLVVFIVTSTWLAGKMVPLIEGLNVRRASLLESYVDFMSNILTVKRLAIHPFAERRLQKKTDDNYRQIQRLQAFHANRWLLLHGLYGIAFLSTIVFILSQIAHGQASIAILILFIAAYATIKRNIERISENFKLLIEMRSYVESVEGIMGSAQPPAAGHGADWQTIVFTDVHFTYPNTGRSVHIPQFELHRGEVVGVTGVSGEGKTTLLNFLTNFLEPDAGERTVDGQSYRQLPPGFFQQRMSMISQEIELFNISLRDNIVLGETVDDGRLLELLDAVDLGDWVRGLTDGLDTIVGEKGIHLSVGQKQRVNLLRGVLLNREVLLLDEPTAHLDAATEQRVVTFLGRHLAGKTAIIVSHRPALQTLCQRHYRMAGGVLETVT